MKHTKYPLLLCIISILLASSVLADYSYTTNWFYNGNPVNNVRAMNFVCADANCVTLGTQAADTTSPTNKVSLVYQTPSPANGYGTYWFAQCYRAQEMLWTPICSGSCSYEENVNFNKHTDCIADINTFSAPVTAQPGQTVQIAANIDSATSEANRAPYDEPDNPEIVRDFFSSDTTIDVTIKNDATGQVVFSQKVTKYIVRDGNENVLFQWIPASAGNYTIILTTVVPDCKCLNDIPDQEIRQIRVSGTAPVCGDGNLDPDEQCDDGNTANGDGCSSSCQVEQICNPISFSQQLTCDQGLNCQYDGLFQNSGMGFYNNLNTFTFSAPSQDVYSCDITVRGGDYGYYDGDTPQTNERSDAWLNGNYLGKTSDLYCNTETVNNPSATCIYRNYDDGTSRPDDWVIHPWFDVVDTFHATVNLATSGNSLVFQADQSHSIDRITISCTKQCEPECTNNDDCNHLDRDYCSSTQIKHDEGICVAETCQVQTTPVQECNNGLYCDGQEACSNAACQPGTAPLIDDGVLCTSDSCNEATDTILHQPVDSICNDGQFCSGIEYCDPVNDCQPGTPVVCSDNISCTVDVCNEATDSCNNVPDNSYCNDGLYCDGTEICSPVNDCQPGTEVDCSGNDIPGVNTCDNNPDNINVTFDYGAPYTSTCNEQTDSCTTGSQNLTHTCNIPQCGAECTQNSDCAPTFCGVDQCIGRDWHDFTSVPNICSGCSCSDNQCGTPNINYSDPRCTACGDGTVDPGEQCDDGNNNNGDGCSATCDIEYECEVDADCSNLTRDYCGGGSYDCYQESADQPTNCGGLGTGTYALQGLWNGGSNTFDGDWNTGGYNYPSDGSYLYINYTKPNNVIGAIWQAKYQQTDTTNFTLPLTCLNQNPLQLEVYSNRLPLHKITLSCWDGSAWQTILDQSGDANYGQDFSEEAIWWKIGNSGESTTIMHDEGICNQDNECAVETTPIQDCNDGLYCNGEETCSNAACVPGIAPPVDDGQFCTTDYCDEGNNTIKHVPLNADDNLFCTSDYCDENSNTIKHDPINVDDGQFCTIDSCDEQNNTIKHDPKVVSDSVSCTNDVCDEQNDTIKHNPDDSLCNDGLFCNGYEYCHPFLDCRGTTPIDCSAYDLNPVATCNNDPDNLSVTFDYRVGFDSQCKEPGYCTTGDETVISFCAQFCGAECIVNAECPATTCGPDQCVGRDWHDYTNVANTCSSCFCTDNQCGAPAINYSDPRCIVCGDGVIDSGEQCDDGNNESGDGCSATCDIEYECTQNSDCSNLTRDYCTVDTIAHDDGICVDNECTVNTTYIEDCSLKDGQQNECGEFVWSCSEELNQVDCVITDIITHDEVCNNQCVGDSIYTQVCSNVTYYCETNDLLEDCSDRNTDYCSGSQIVEETYDCSEANATASCVLDDTNTTECNDSLYCNGAETCFNAGCQPGTTVDCTGNNIPGVNTCDYTPDGLNYTMDTGNSFTSVCNEATDSCTEENQTITSVCDLTCGSECTDNSDCTPTNCGADQCIARDWYDYSDVSNTCDSCFCSDNECAAPTITYNASVCISCGDGFLDNGEQCDDGNNESGDGCSASCDVEYECTENSDCSNLTRDYCTDNAIAHDEGICVDFACRANTTIIEDCSSKDGIQNECGEQEWSCSEELNQVDCVLTDVIPNNSLCGDVCIGVSWYNETCHNQTYTCEPTDLVIDCSIFNESEISTCDNDPDNISETFDYKPGFVSACAAQPGVCTISNETLTSTCDIEMCGAECTAQNTSQCVASCFNETTLLDPTGICSSACGCEYDIVNCEFGCFQGACIEAVHEIGLEDDYDGFGHEIRLKNGSLGTEDTIADDVPTLYCFEEYDVQFNTHNYGDFTEDVDINVTITGESGQVYTDIDTKDNLASGDDTTTGNENNLLFNFTAGNYTISVKTSINDTEITLDNNSAERSFVLLCPICRSDSDCGDGLACNGIETCNLETYSCEAGSPAVCDDNQSCTVDSCIDGDNNNYSCNYIPIDIDNDGFSLCDGDCDDSNNMTYPDADDICDAEDNDCDGSIDESEDTNIIRIETTTDDIEEVYLDGSFVSQSSDWQTRTTNNEDVLGGEHVLAFQLNNSGGPAGFIASIRAENYSKLFNSKADGTWVYSTDCVGDWTTLDYNDSNWSPLVKVGDYGDAPWLTDVVGWSDATADWLWNNDTNQDICVRKKFNVTTYLTQECGSGVCNGTQICIDGEFDACSSFGTDAGTCALCDEEGNATYDDTQDDECSPTICPAGACGLYGCADDEFASFVPQVENMCMEIYTCTDYECQVSCIDEDLSTDRFSFRSDGGSIQYIGPDFEFDNLSTIIDLSSWVTRLPYGDVDGVTSLEVTTKTDEGLRVTLYIRFDVRYATIACDEIYVVQSGTGTYYKTGVGRQSVQCTAEYWLDRITETVDIRGSCDGIAFGIDDIDSLEWV